MKIKALTPVCSGFVRVKNKNIAPFAGSSLLEIKIRQMLRIPELDGVVVNSNLFRQVLNGATHAYRNDLAA